MRTGRPKLDDQADGLSVAEIAKREGVTRGRINQLLMEKRGVRP